MADNTRKKVAGRIILVQEDRFRVVERTGKGYLFMLSRMAQTSQEDLQRFHDEDVSVLVTYEGEPNLSTGIAHNVERFP